MQHILGMGSDPGTDIIRNIGGVQTAKKSQNLEKFSAAPSKPQKTIFLAFSLDYWGVRTRDGFKKSRLGGLPQDFEIIGGAAPPTRNLLGGQTQFQKISLYLVLRG